MKECSIDSTEKKEALAVMKERLIDRKVEKEALAVNERAFHCP